MWTRRSWLKAMAGASGAVAACGDDRSSAGDPEAPAPVDAAIEGVLPRPSPDWHHVTWVDEDVPITKGPCAHALGPDVVRLRLESTSEDPIEIVFEEEDGTQHRIETSPTVEDIDYAWPPGRQLRVDNRDEAGRYAIHDVVLAGLAAGTQLTWRIEGLEPVEGRVRVPPGRGMPSRVAWISDTMYPTHARVADALATYAPDLSLHGGDLQYQTNPFDTWNGFYHAMRPLLRLGAFHACPGNHEYEEQNEFEVQYLRFFGGQGEEGRGVDYYALTWSGIRFLMLNSEDGFGAGPSPQRAWVEAALAEADADPNVWATVPCFHRPYYTFSRSRPSLSNREAMHGLFRQHRVPLVLTGHNHCYERFLVDGITYVVDGGGGAFLYSVDHHLADAREREPEHIDDRLVASTTHGGLIMDIDEGGEIHVQRVGIEGDIEDDVRIAPSGELR